MINSSGNLTGKVFGTCILEALIGRGGMSLVYRAQQIRPVRTVAVKILLPAAPVGSNLHNQFLARFEREANIIAKLQHPNIIANYECGEQDGEIYLVMPYLTGGSLSKLLAQRGVLTLQETLNYIGQAAAALDYAHQHGVIHRDLKPSNFLLDDQGRLVLVDFGIARIMQDSGRSIDSTLTSSGILLGTPDYMSPEMIRSEQQIDHRTDIYELGIVLFQMLSGTVPFKGNPTSVLIKHLQEMPPLLHELNPTIPPAVDDVIYKATAKRREDRFATAGSMAQALHTAIITPQYPSEPVSPIAPTVLSARTISSNGHNPTQAMELPRSKPGSPRRLWSMLFALVLVAALAFSGMILANAQISKDQRQSTSTPTSTPSQQVQTAVQQYYNDINNHDYQAAYKLLVASDYCTFIDDYAHTLHDDITFNSITLLPDGTYNAELTITARENLPPGILLTTYSANHVVQKENGIWKLLPGSLNKIDRSQISGPIPAITTDSTPSQQAQAVVQQYYGDVNTHDYPSAYNLWGNDFQNSTDYCSFVNGYANTVHDEITFNSITPSTNGGIQVVATITAKENRNSKIAMTRYLDNYIVGDENNSWRILSGTQSVI
jgi:serine/threonine protein kinase